MAIFLRHWNLEVCFYEIYFGENCIWGRYLSMAVMLLNLRKSLQDLHSPSLLRTGCNGFAHCDEEGQHILCANIASNSCFAVAYFSGSSLCGLSAKGGPLVIIWCLTSCTVFLSAVGRVISTYLRRSSLTLHSLSIVATVVCFPMVILALVLSRICSSTSLLFFRSGKIPWYARKFAPIIGCSYDKLPSKWAS